MTGVCAGVLPSPGWPTGMPHRTLGSRQPAILEATRALPIAPAAPTIRLMAT
jgi:hypothetical protein